MVIALFTGPRKARPMNAVMDVATPVIVCTPLGSSSMYTPGSVGWIGMKHPPFVGGRFIAPQNCCYLHMGRDEPCPYRVCALLCTRCIGCWRLSIIVQQTGFHKVAQLRPSLYKGFTAAGKMANQAAFHPPIVVAPDTQQEHAIFQLDFFGGIIAYHPYLHAISPRVMPAPQDNRECFTAHSCFARDGILSLPMQRERLAYLRLPVGFTV